MIFGYAKDLQLPIETSHDVLLVGSLEGLLDCIECKHTWDKSPEDILEEGIPTSKDCESHG